jgi:hypothetical protein
LVIQSHPLISQAILNFPLIRLRPFVPFVSFCFAARSARSISTISTQIVDSEFTTPFKSSDAVHPRREKRKVRNQHIPAGIIVGAQVLW